MKKINQCVLSINSGALMWLCGAALLLLSISQSVMAESTLMASSPHVINVVDGYVDGKKVIKLKQGDLAEFHWISDRSLHIHLHGYDIEALIGPNNTGLTVLEAYATGRFPVTTHQNEGGHTHGVTEETLIYIEVYPR